MKKALILAIFGVMVAVIPASAAEIKPTTKASTKSVVTTKKPVAKPVKTTKKVAAKTPAKAATPKAAFSAQAAADAKTTTGAKPPDGYMEALNKAQATFYAEQKAAKGNKAKIKAASDKYDAALIEAMALLN